MIALPRGSAAHAPKTRDPYAGARDGNRGIHVVDAIHYVASGSLVATRSYAAGAGMSMIGEYLRVTSAELARAINDPAWALEFAESIQVDADDALPPESTRYFSTYKTWDMLRFLLQRTGFPIDITFGEEPFTQDDWGYGPARYLGPDRVRLAPAALGNTSYDVLIRGVNHMELAAADVYPAHHWDEPSSLEWARGYYRSLARFFTAAARDGDGMLAWLD
jgi:hypothetical protein